MKVVIAAWHLKNPNVGLGRYCGGLIDAIGRVDRENRYEILVPDPAVQLPPRPNVRYRVVRFPILKRRFWEQAAPLLVGRYDVLHFPHDSRIAWKRGKFVVTIHDVKPLLFEALRSRSPVNRAIERAVIGDGLDRIDHVLTDSESSRRDIRTHLNVPPDRLTVVYPGIDLERFRPLPERGRAAGARPYVLSVGGADPTKNVGALVDAFAQLPRSVRDRYDLVLAGDFRKREDVRLRIAQLSLEKQTIFTGLVSDDRLIELYQRAALFVFPSLYEGFGLPVLEAMACGCPVICSNVSSLPEVAGDAAVLVDPKDAAKLADEMARVLTDESLQDELRRRGTRQASRFPWERTARETVAVYKRVAGLR